MNKNWISVVNGLEMSDDMQKTLIQNCRKKKHAGDALFRYSKIIAFALGVVIFGVFGITGYACVNFVQQRMESMPAEEVEERNNEIQSSDVKADTYSREFSDTEKERYKELLLSYQNGVFPEGEIERVEVLEAATKDKIYYVISSGTFLLPDRELTDEEMLEYIDYLHKTNYSLGQSDEALEIQKEKESEQADISSKITENNGITEAEAITSTRKIMQEWFKLSTDGYECTHYAYEEEVGVKLGYRVNYSMVGVGDNNDFYYFSFNAENGDVIEVDHSGGMMTYEENISEKDITASISTLEQEAEEYLLDVIGMQNEKYDVYYKYIVSNNDKIVTNSITFLFAVDENEVYQIDWLYDVHEFSKYKLTTLQSCKDSWDDYTIEYVYEKFVSEN